MAAHPAVGPSGGAGPPDDAAKAPTKAAAGAAPARRSTRLSRPARRRQLLGAARQVFVAQGYHAAAMDEIAERAGVSKPVLYQHFPGKLDLYLALLDESAGELVDRVRQALNSTTDNALRVRRTMDAYFDFVDDDNGAYQLVFESDLRTEPAVRARVEGSLSECVEAIATTIAADTGVPRAEAELLSVGLAGLAEVGARWWLGSRGMPGSTATPGPARSLSKERAVELMVDLAWRGLSGSPRHGDFGQGDFGPGNFGPGNFGHGDFAAESGAQGESSVRPFTAGPPATSPDQPDHDRIG